MHTTPEDIALILDIYSLARERGDKLVMSIVLRRARADEGLMAALRRLVDRLGEGETESKTAHLSEREESLVAIS
jgi:hypothetical protein